jgi:hypothetical protein
VFDIGQHLGLGGSQAGIVTGLLAILAGGKISLVF